MTTKVPLNLLGGDIGRGPISLKFFNEINYLCINILYYDRSNSLSRVNSFTFRHRSSKLDE
jgi:hypothetical protein